jgi:hypothetical protein
MTSKPQEICDQFIKLSKDRDGLLVALSSASGEVRKRLGEDLENLEKSKIPSENKQKMSDEKEKDNFIDHLKITINNN